MAKDSKGSKDEKEAGEGFRDTLNLPVTEFPMRADLAKREPEMLQAWEAEGLYDQILAARAAQPKFVLHDGPPYANGNIHYGHILNKILKDIVVKYRTMAGNLCVYKPGWDTHGLPIELQVDRDLGPEKKATMSKLEIRRACHEYAMKFVDIQRSEFKRLGVFGTWGQPYLTLDKSYEATIVRQLAALARGGYLYKGKKPVHWCASCRTALAEAEVEYEDKKSPSIFVAFPLVDTAKLPAPLAGQRVSFVIWTTTPWTLPANLAVVLHPEYEYVAVPVTRTAGVEYLIVAKQLAESFLTRCKLDSPPAGWVSLSKAAVHSLEGQRYTHPLIPTRAEADHRAWFADHVTLEAGTGIVHTAPGHGADDYKVGQEHGLEIYAPVDDGGKFTAEGGDYAGMFVFKANPLIIAKLVELGALLSDPADQISHSYPHCWRCKNPIIFRATPQWFASMEHNDLRARALVEIGKTSWIPPWGENRIRGMIENRPDWCLSRQRVWGVPIPVFTCVADGEPLADPAVMAHVMDHVAEIFALEGADAWYDREVAELMPGGLRCAKCGGGEWRKEEAIVDVWFESGVSWAAVCEPDRRLSNAHDKHSPPVDLYLEGSDQHRGWFHSSLLASTATRGHRPYKTVLTHGFVLSERGRPYSKSEIQEAKRQGLKIEYVAPADLIAKNGAEVLRMWVAGADFRTDVTYSRAVLDNLGEAYRKIRNTFRFLLGNLHGFDPARHVVPDGELEPFDRYILRRVRAMAAASKAHYDEYVFHAVVKDMIDLCAVELSALYFDVTKDRLYCESPGSARRRSAQTVCYEVARTLAIVAAPILCFTADEIWKYLPRGPHEVASVHLAQFEDNDAIDDEDDRYHWSQLLELRSEVQKALEPFRREKHSPLDAAVEIVARHRPALGEAALAELFGVSKVTLKDGTPTGEGSDIRVEHAAGTKCPRCWKWGTPSGSPLGADLDERCAQVMAARSP